MNTSIYAKFIKSFRSIPDRKSYIRTLDRFNLIIGVSNVNQSCYARQSYDVMSNVVSRQFPFNSSILLFMVLTTLSPCNLSSLEKPY